ncbi:protein kinase domain-containing protein [Streptomyces sp. HMX112]|uniref:serine/threonine-protein kinase n=1 Tax=Streptomyces sp. HMX112 TaxID=3390850 RepID=UPI003A7FBBFD
MRVRQWPFRPEARLSDRVVAGRYRLDERVGTGGAADVHRALDLRLRRPVAVKLFRPGTDTQWEDSFTDEAVLLARLQHPGLVTVYDTGRHDGRPFLVMQLVEGPNLRRRIASGPLTPQATAALGTGLAQALAHVHDAGIVHRDVKPSNVLLDAGDNPYLTDFGISRLIDTTTTRTVTGALIGTAAYLAPEQVLGRGAGPAADVYALGLVLLECLKGRLEYDGPPLEAAMARLHRPPALPDSLGGGMADLLTAMTAQDEAERPDAHACAEALAALQEAPARTGTHAVGLGAASPAPAGGDGPDRAVLAARAGGAADSANRGDGAGGNGTAGGSGAGTPGDGTTGRDAVTARRRVPAVPVLRRRRRVLVSTGTAAIAAAVVGATLSASGPGSTAEGERSASRPPVHSPVQPGTDAPERPSTTPDRATRPPAGDASAAVAHRTADEPTATGLAVTHGEGRGDTRGAVPRYEDPEPRERPGKDKPKDDDTPKGEGEVKDNGNGKAKGREQAPGKGKGKDKG